MYRLPELTDIEPLIGQRLTQICCAINQVSFHFARGVRIVAEIGFDYYRGGDSTIEVTMPIATATIFELLEVKIENIEVQDDRQTLAVFFDRGRFLRFSSKANFESFHIHLDGREFVI